MKIMLVGNYFYPEHTGGIETVSYNLVKHYRDSGHMVRWVAADVLPRLRSFGPDDVPIRAWNVTEEKLGFPQPIPYPGVFLKLYNNIRWCDVVHLQDCLYIINIITFLVAKLLYKPILITQYAKVIPYTQYYKRILQAIAYRTIGWMMFTTADKVVFITANVRDNMQYINPVKMRDVVPLGVDTDFYSPLPELERVQLRKKLSGAPDIPIVLFVGRMVERKGVHLIRPLIERHKEWRWILVGRPDDYNPGEWEFPNLTYYQYASENDLRELYASADLLVHPSVGEGVTLIVSECLATGTPVVISHESLYEVNEMDRELFLPVQPETNAIEEKMINALADHVRMDDLRVICREYALDRLSWKIMTEHYLNILNELTNAKRSMG